MAKKLSTDRVRASMHIVNPQSVTNNAVNDVESVDKPVATRSMDAGESLIRLSVNSVVPYENNPRTILNERYLEIKESIRVRGLDNIFKITKRPGEDFYFPARGGNTRLIALKELFRDTKKERYGVVDFIYTPYKSESDVRAGHIIENDTRSDLIFWDKAQALLNLKAEIESEIEEQLSNRQYEEILSERGIPVGREILRTYNFANEYLGELGTATARLSRQGVREIIMPAFLKLTRLAQRFGVTKEMFASDVADPVFRGIAQVYSESGNFSVDALCEALVDATAATLELDSDTTRRMLVMIEKNPNATKDELLAPIETVVEPTIEPVTSVNTLEDDQEHDQDLADDNGADDSETDAEESNDVGQNYAHTGSTKPERFSKANEILFASGLTPGNHTRQKQEDPTGSLDLGSGGDQNVVHQAANDGAARNLSNDIDALKRQFISHLQEFSNVTGLTECLRLDESLPLWFYVELPIPKTVGIPLDIESSEGENRCRYAAWWYLAGLCGVLTDNDQLPSDSPIKAALADDEKWDDEIRNRIGEPLYQETLGSMLGWIVDPDNVAGEALLNLLSSLRQILPASFVGEPS